MKLVKVRSIVSEKFFFLKKKLTNAHTHARTHANTWLYLYKSIINKIKEICIHKFSLPTFDVVIVCILATRLHKALILLLSNLRKVISLGLALKLCKFILLYSITKGK